MYLNRRTVLVGVFVDLSLQLGQALLLLGAQPKVFGLLAHLRHIQRRLLAERHDVVLGEKAERGARDERLLEKARVPGKEPALHLLLNGHDASRRPSYSGRAPKKAPLGRANGCCSGSRAPPRAARGFDSLVKPGRRK